MATTKRERQRANRELREAELKKQQRRDTIRTRTVRWAKIAVLVVVLLFISNWIFNSSSDEPVLPTTTTLVEAPAP